jgi:hypothetical protein
VTYSFKGYNVFADPLTIATIADAAEVDYVEVDARVHLSYLTEVETKNASISKRALVSQYGAPWGLGMSLKLRERRRSVPIFRPKC